MDFTYFFVCTTDRKVNGFMNYGKKGVRAKQKALNSKSMKWGRKIALTCVKVALIGVIALGIIGVSVGIGAFNGILSSAPDITSNDVAPSGFSTFVYDSEGNQIAKLVSSNSNRIPVTMDMIPEDLANAFVAIEDERFYEHNGVDIKGMLRSGYQFFKTGGDSTQGASTITQQLLKNTIFTDWVSEESLIEKIPRKLQEQYLALKFTKMVSKEETLERYMNTINLGQNTLGVQAASYRYFNKPVSELTLSECVTIAGITQNPSKYNPISHPDKNAERRTRVLNKMLELEYINQAEYDEALADNVYDRIQLANVEIKNDSVNSYFVDAIQSQVMDDLIAAGYNATQASSLLLSGGLKIHSTMDPSIQAIADAVFSNEENYPKNVKWYLNYDLSVKTKGGETANYSKEMMKTYFVDNVEKNFNLIFSSQEDAYAAIDQYKAAVMAEGDEEIAEKISLTPQPQVSLTICDQHTGYVVAMIGGRGAKEGNLTLNRATDTTRQPGSCFKILAAYAPALDSAGLTLASVFNDAPFNYDTGTPVNNWYKTGYRGLNPIRIGIRDSMNIVTVKVLTQITPQLGFDYLQTFGFTSLEQSKDCYQPLALGGISKGVKNIELNAAYASIANNGLYVGPKLYTKVVDSEGNVILDNTDAPTRQVIKETTSFLLTNAMVDVVTSGTGSSVKFGNMAIAGKTGTTSDAKDVWFSGYTPYYTATVWAGYDNNVPLSDKAGEQNLAKKLWRAVMSEVHKDLPSQAFPVPNGITQASICSRSGKLPIAGICDAHIRTEYFAEGTVPTDMCNVHFIGTICAYSTRPACEACPFKIEGTAELMPIEDISLQAGSSVITQNPDGTASTAPPAVSNNCPHDTVFFENPDHPNILNQQKAELEARGMVFEVTW